jgi:hypothetical protein
VINERRAELRKVAYTSIAAIEKEAIAAQTRKIIELEAKVVMTGMASDEAKSMLADIMNLDVLRPKIEASEIAKMLESRNRTNLYYTHRDYSSPPVDDCWRTAAMTAIEWTDDIPNVVAGCDYKSRGCAHCSAPEIVAPRNTRAKNRRRVIRLAERLPETIASASRNRSCWPGIISP